MHSSYCIWYYSSGFLGYSSCFQTQRSLSLCRNQLSCLLSRRGPHPTHPALCCNAEVALEPGLWVSKLIPCLGPRCLVRLWISPLWSAIVSFCTCVSALRAGKLHLLIDWSVSPNLSPQSMCMSSLLRQALTLSELDVFPCCSRLTSGPHLLRGWAASKKSASIQGNAVPHVSSLPESKEDYSLFLFQKTSDP